MLVIWLINLNFRRNTDCGIRLSLICVTKIITVVLGVQLILQLDAYKLTWYCYDIASY